MICQLKYSDFFAELKYFRRKLCFICRNGEGEILLSDLAELCDLLKEASESLVILSADLEGSVNKNVGYVVVACDYAAEEAVERIVAADAVVVGLNEPCTVVDIVGKEPFLFDADYVAVGLR